MRYIIRPKPHIKGKCLKRFYRSFGIEIPYNWIFRPPVVVEMDGKTKITYIGKVVYGGRLS